MTLSRAINLYLSLPLATYILTFPWSLIGQTHLLFHVYILFSYLFSFLVFAHILRKAHNKLKDTYPIKLKKNILAALIIYYSIQFAHQIVRAFSSNISLYASTVRNVVSQDSSFTSRIFSYYIPESFFLVIFILTLSSFWGHKKSVSYTSQNYNRYCYILMLVMFLNRLFSGSLNSIATVAIMTSCIYSFHYNTSALGSLKKYLKNILRIFKGFVKIKLIPRLILSVAVISSILYVSFNRAGNPLYMAQLIFLYSDMVNSYQSELFNHFLDNSPVGCHLQSNGVLYLFSKYNSIAECLSSFKYTLSSSGLYLKGSWFGHLGAHVIDVGSYLSLLSIFITLICYYILSIAVIQLRTDKSTPYTCCVCMIIICILPLTLCTYLTGFATVNLLIFVISVLISSLLCSLGLIFFDIPSVHQDLARVRV